MFFGSGFQPADDTLWDYQADSRKLGPKATFDWLLKLFLDTGTELLSPHHVDIKFSKKEKPPVN